MIPSRFVAALWVGVALAAGTSACGGDRPPQTSIPVAGPSPTAPAAPTATPLVLPPVSPAALSQQTIDGEALEGDGWAVDGLKLTLQMPFPLERAVAPEVEVQPVGTAFVGKPTLRGAAVLPQDGILRAEVALKGLPPGRYQWQARLIDEETGQVAAWTAYRGGEMGFGVITGVPLIENAAIAGTTHQLQGQPVVGSADAAKVIWSVRANPMESLARVAYRIDQRPDGVLTVPDSERHLGPKEDTLPLTGLTDGRWFIHLWAIDRAGQVSPAATVPVVIQRTSPRIDDLIYRTWVTNPQFQTLPIRFAVSAQATIDVTILPADSDAPLRAFHFEAEPAGQRVDIAWDGKDQAGQTVAPGTYRFRIRAVDAAGNPTEVVHDDLHITDRVIQVWLAQQSLTAADGSGTVVHSLVTSGGQALPTRTGTFEVESKEAPFTFHSPYPRGSRFWYPDTPANYAMLFDPSEANFLHDAPWRTVFGPGTNGPGTPGYSVWAGSHGCVELPTSAMKRLFDWTQLGTPVIIHE